MFKLTLFILFLSINSLATEDNKSKKIQDLLSSISNTIDSNSSNQIKLIDLKEHFSNLKLDDNIDKKKYSFNIMSHHQNFLLFASYSPDKLTEKHWDTNGNRDYNKDYKRKSNESQFQLSLKVPLYNDFLNTGADLFTAYTQNSYWQVYDKQHSSPFRETNYMPELFLEWQPNKLIANLELQKIRFSLIHQSNGQDIGKSRSWNRSEIYFLFKKSNYLYGMNIWDRWDENTKTSNDSVDGDDNPNLDTYIGKQKYFIKCKNDNYNISLTHQNNIFDYSKSKGNSKIDISFPSINNNFDFFIRYFNGYGESLIDYDVKVKRLSFGIIIANWN